MKKRRILFNIAIVVLLVLTFTMLVACDPANSTKVDVTIDNIDLTPGLLISNSDFKVASTSSYPGKIKNWSASPYSTSSLDSTSVISGVISLDPDKYALSSPMWTTEKNKGYVPDLKQNSTDKNMLMIYMPEKGDDVIGIDEEKKDYKYGPTAYSYSSPSFNIEKGNYYKLTVDAMTKDLKGKDSSQDYGARIYLSSSAYAEFISLKNTEWETYEIYIEGSASAAKSLTLSLSLGYYSSSFQTGMTTGYAFFDNVTLEKTTQKTYLEKVTAEKTDDHVKTTTYRVPNGEFDFGSKASNSSSSAPSLWTVSVGSSSTDNASPTGYRYNGIVDTNKDNWTNVQTKLGTTIYRLNDEGNNVVSSSSYDRVSNPGAYQDALGNNAYMLSSLYFTSQYIYSSTPIVIEKGKYYELAVPVYTQDIYGGGVSITLSGNGTDVSFKNISSRPLSDEELAKYKAGQNLPQGNSTGAWRLYKFGIKGNQYRDMAFTLQLWLGTGDTTDYSKSIDITRFTGSGAYTDADSFKNKTTYKSYYENAQSPFSLGYAFFDSIKLNEIQNIEGGQTAEERYNAIAGNAVKLDDEDTTVDGEANHSMKLDLSQNDGFGGQGNFGSNTYNTNYNYDDDTLGTPNGWVVPFDKDENDKIIYNKIDGITLKNDDKYKTYIGSLSTTDNKKFEDLGLTNPGLPYSLENKNVLTLHSPVNQLLSIDSSEFTLKRNTSYRISIWLKTKDVKDTSGVYISLRGKDDKNEEVELKKSSLINTAKVENEFTNDWVEYTFVVRGYSTKDLQAKLRFTLGSGDKFSNTTLTSGTAYFANVNMQTISEDEYKTLSSSTTNSANLSYADTESGFTIANPTFKLFKLDETKLDADGKLKDLAVPTNWTKSTTKHDKTSGVYSGIAQFDYNETSNKYVTSSQLTTLFEGTEFANKFATATDSIYNNWPTQVVGAPNALLIASDSTNNIALGYNSDKFTLSAETIYKISVKVKTIGTNVKYSLYLNSESGFIQERADSQSSNITMTNTGSTTMESEWTTHTFFVKIGLNTASMKLGMWLGEQPASDQDSDITAASSNGAVFFDSILCETITTEDFVEAKQVQNSSVEFKNSRVLSFVSDSFDATESNVTSKTELTSGKGWVGSTVANGTKSYTKTGVVYTGNDTPTVDVDSKAYSSLLGLDKPADEASEADKEAYKKSLLPISELNAKTGNYMLVINNTKDNGYYYKSSSYTLKKDSFYKISLWVRTYDVIDTNGASVELYIKNYAKKATNVNSKATAVSADGWQQITFFVKTADTDVTNVYLTLGLGKEGHTETEKGMVSGFAMFDDIAFEKITEPQFDVAKANFGESNKVTDRDFAFEIGAGSTFIEDDTDNKTQPEFKPDLTYLWWMIPTIVIVLILIVVIVVLFVKKVYKPRKDETVKKQKYDKDPESSQALEEKQNKYDDMRE